RQRGPGAVDVAGPLLDLAQGELRLDAARHLGDELLQGLHSLVRLALGDLILGFRDRVVHFLVGGEGGRRQEQREQRKRSGLHAILTDFISSRDNLIIPGAWRPSSSWSVVAAVC